jgi:hypothetical protein
MRHSKWAMTLLVTLLALVPAVLVGSDTARGNAAPTEFCGVILTSQTIFENSKLVCDVVCPQADYLPCINFGKPGIKFSLNGFTMTGPANPPPALTDPATPPEAVGCAPLPGAPDLPGFPGSGNFPPADGIHSVHDDVVIEGPGVVQRFRRHGVALFGPPGTVDKAVVKKLVSHQNCYSGVWLNGVTESVVEEVVAVKNSAASRQLPCGGVCVTNSHNNRVRRSELAGNGSIFPTTVGGVSGVPNDFGVGLVGSSRGNIIEENGIGGNINGIMLHPTAAGSPTANLIRKNVVAGNPPIQVSASPGVSPSPDPVGSDIRDFGAASCSLDTTSESECPPAANRFRENLCLTYTGPNPNPLVNPCLRSAVGVRLPQFAGHQNN